MSSKSSWENRTKTSIWFWREAKIREVYAIVPLDILLVEQKTEQQHRETVTFTWQKKNGTAGLSVFYINDPSLQRPCIIKVLSSFFPLCVFVYVGVWLLHLTEFHHEMSCALWLVLDVPVWSYVWTYLQCLRPSGVTPFLYPLSPPAHLKITIHRVRPCLSVWTQ